MKIRDDYSASAIRDWERLRVRDDLLAYAIALRLIRAGRILDSRLDQVSRREGFGVKGDYDVLAALRRVHPEQLRPQDLAGRVMVSPPGITGRLDRLEAAGFIAREPHPLDRRSTLLRITDEGIAAVDRTFREILAGIEELLAELGTRDRQETATRLQRLMLALGDTAPE